MYPDQGRQEAAKDPSAGILRTHLQEREARMGASTRIDPPADRPSLGQLLERNYQVVVNVHEELNILENVLGPVLVLVPAVNEASGEPMKASTAFAEQLGQQIDGLMIAVRRLRSLRERLAL